MTRTRRPRPVTAAALLAVLVVATGCGGGVGDGRDDDELSASAESRRPMPSCGAYEAPLGELAPEQLAARDCFLAAFAEGREAEVAITVSSFEGDPVTTIYRVVGPNEVELFVDASADTFAAATFYRQRCTSVAEEGTALAATNCTTTATSGGPEA